MITLRHPAATPKPAAGDPPGYPHITVTNGMSGHFAVMIWWNPDGFPEPYNTADDRHPDKTSAIRDARIWAEAENLEFQP